MQFPEASTAQFPQGYRRAQAPTPPFTGKTRKGRRRKASELREHMSRNYDPAPAPKLYCAPVPRATACAGVAHTSETSGSRFEIVTRGGAVKPEQGFLLWVSVLNREQER